MAYLGMSWHSGESKIQALTKVPRQDNPSNPALVPRAAQVITLYPLMALGTVDPKNDNRPWCTLWGGDPPFAQPIARGGIIGIRTTIDASFDPVAQSLLGQSHAGEVMKVPERQRGGMVSILSISLEERSRWKMYGRMVAGALDAEPSKQESEDRSQGKAGSVQLVLKIEESLANCPKYLNKKVITTYTPHPQLISESIRLCDEAVDLIRQADMFFVSSSQALEDMDTNHRGGPPGFIRVQQPDIGSLAGSVIVWPEYSGNNLYQTLGNLMTTPRAGLCIPNFETGDVLYLTGDTEVLINEQASQVIAKSRLAVRLTVTGARLVKEGLGFRGKLTDDTTAGRSPYNPVVRYLRDEKVQEFADGPGNDVKASLIKKTQLSPTIFKYRFALSDPTAYGPWRPGQYVALDFSDELDMGYSHMRNDDPQSLNDDYMRTFTVSSPPDSLGVHGEEFEMMIRKVGKVTDWLSCQRVGQPEIGVRGFGGEFVFDVKPGGKAVFLAAGIGITPLLGQVGTVRDVLTRWSVGIKDVGVVLDVWEQCSDEIKDSMIVYLSGNENDLTRTQDKEAYQRVMQSKNKVERRRMAREDLTVLEDEVSDWYLCTAPAMRKIIQGWVPGKSIVFENFDY